MPGDFLYKNAPLLEVIAEVRWRLPRLKTIPGGGYDPFFEQTAPLLARALAELGFKTTERLVPPDIPIELLGNQPIFRYRREPGAYPLYQFGPGVFACNIVPPYAGWSVFREVIRDGTRAFFGVRQNAMAKLPLTKFDLRYLDLFTTKHGLSDYVSFLTNDLGINTGLREGVLSELDSSATHLIPTGQTSFPLGHRWIRVGFGAREQADGIRALSLELGVSSNIDSETGSETELRDDVMEWMDESHRVLHLVFESLTSERLKAAMGPRIMLE